MAILRKKLAPIQWLASSTYALSTFCLTVLLMTNQVAADAIKTKGQRIYLPIYSSIPHTSNASFDLTVTISFRNIDETASISLQLAEYYDNDGGNGENLLLAPRVIGPLGSSDIIIQQSQFRGDFGANVILVWEAVTEITPPLVEAVMVGYRGTQAFAFTSRGVVLD